MKKFITICCSLFVLGKASAQDPHFSQFFSSPLTLSPAFTGKFDGTFRVAGNYRNQWPTINNAFTTATASVDFKVMQNKIASNDMWGVGVMGYNDNSANGAVNFNYFTLSTAYHKGLDEDGFHQLSGGFQVTYANMLINTANLKFEDQLTSNGFTGVTNEVFNNSTLKSNYIDVNAGILYSGSTNERNNFYFGVSLYHLTSPKQSFTGATYNLAPRATIHAGTFFPLAPNATLHLSGLQSFQGGASETVIGGAVQLIATPDAEKPVSIYAGSWLRFNDAIIPYFGLEFGDLRMGITYDVNTSSLKTASQGVGGLELSLIYVRRPSTDKPIICPKF
jgi:type IX secretion system PorP/SprF family membrane protein